ncbi:hypothetical protein F5I97DRAFT_1923642 [Phlebopus sp. FC_14]|nr:hypothetical protein F5I97DRAFT_1923642 [Phlebopus sp. FC_14]
MIHHHEPDSVWSVAPVSPAPTVRSFQFCEVNLIRVHVLSYILIFHNYLTPITELYGDEFLHVWWTLVGGHLVLWKNGVYHQDISSSKLMYYRDKNSNVVGVLIDFDLTLSDGAQHIIRAASFMALDLLTDEALRGEVQHLYEHNTESFIWVLT